MSTTAAAGVAAPAEAYVINLDARPERWDSFCAHHHNINATATTSIEASAAAMPMMMMSYVRVQAVEDPANPARGCTLSHRKCVANAAKMRLPYVLVLEDDARRIETAAAAAAADSELLNKIAAAALKYSLGEECVVFLGAGTLSPHNVRWVSKIDSSNSSSGGDGSKKDVVLLGCVHRPNGIITATHSVLYVASADARCSYESILTCLGPDVEEGRRRHDDDDDIAHTDLLLSSYFAGTGRLFVVIPFLYYFEDRDEYSDVRIGKRTGADYALMRNTEAALMRSALETQQ